MRGRTCDAYQTLYASRNTITSYNRLSRTDENWYCYQCQLSTFSDSFFSTTSPESEITDDECENTGIFDYIRHDHPSGFIAAYLNINSARNKIIHIREALKRTPVDILGIAETKIDDSFPDSQFTIDGYRLFRRDRI